MLKALKFVQGAIATKDFVPALTHFRIEGGRVMGCNGRIALSSPIDLDLTASPKAVPFVKALEACGENEVALHLTPQGRLCVKAGKFRSFVECTTEPYPPVDLVPDPIPYSGGFLDVLAKLRPFIGQDASRPWARGILFRDSSAFATNNIVLVEHWLGTNMPEPLCIPETTVRELLRIGEEPEHVCLSGEQCTFYYKGDRWLWSTTLSTQWPDLSKVLDNPSSAQAIPPGFFECLKTLRPFVDDGLGVHLYEGAASTANVDGQGTGVEIEGLHALGLYHIDQLLSIEGLATTIDLTSYPKPSLFYGDMVRGAIIGKRI